jgi:thioesterase domain-containing protein
VRSFLAYEFTSKAKGFSDALRFRLLRAVLDRGGLVPRFLQGMSVATVLSLAYKDYSPRRLLEGKAILIRSTQGEGSDEPVSNRTKDPLLGWGGRVQGRLEILDMPAGHSSMLQEPYVSELVEHIISSIDQALAAV